MARDDNRPAGGRLDASGRRKAFVAFRDAGEKRAGTPLLRALLEVAYQRGEMAARNNEALPPSFVELFGHGAALTQRVLKGDASGFDAFSEGGTLRRREAALLRYLGGGTLGSTARLKESVVAGVACVVSLPNPAMTAPSGTEAGASATGKAGAEGRTTERKG